MAAVLGGHGLERKGIFAGHGGGMGRKPVHLYFERRHGHAAHHRNPGTRELQYWRLSYGSVLGHFPAKSGAA